MYFSSFIYNKSKEKTIILIHGAYGTAGFWLPYLKLFNGYKIIVFNMDYSSILNTEYDLKSTKLLLEKYVLDQNLIAVISHSLGTIFSHLFSFKNQAYNFNICPMVYSKRINIDIFKIELQSRLTNKNFKITTNANLINKLIEESKRCSTKNIFYFTPIFDNFFIYDYPSYINNNFFNGNHFDVANAINIISKKLIAEF